jgi:predicted ATPase
MHEMKLDFLSPKEVEDYLALMFPGPDLPPEFPSLIYAKTEGNPLFMVDLVRYLRERDVIAREEGIWKLKQRLPDIKPHLPESVRGMIEYKMAQLAEQDHRLLAAASVQGYEFDSAVVARALTLDEREVEERLEVLENVYAFVRLIEEREFPTRTPALRYRFTHVLYQNEFYTALGPARRSALSGAVAEAVLELYGERKDAAAKGERITEALAALDDSLGLAKRNEERFWEAELHRLRGSCF